MTLFVGTDEAGYGPNLGPLMICATAWRVPDAPPDLDLYQRLAAVVGRTPAEALLAIADSKSLYHSGHGLAQLESAVFASLAALRVEARTWRSMWQQLVPTLCSDFLASPWHCDYDETVPIHACTEELGQCAERFCNGLTAAQVHLQAVVADALFPPEFNQLVRRYRSKGEVLSRRTLELVHRVWQNTDDALTVVYCDKHGGRNSYQPLLQTVFAEYLVEVRQESRASSIYRWGPADRRIEFHFCANGERFLPTALSSIFAKYLRELAMRAFNAFWRTHLGELRPTAGYAVDAKRFVNEISTTRRALAIAKRQFWRSR